MRRFYSLRATSKESAEMALNKFMHPRNPYKDHKPNFKELSEKYEQFRDQTTVDDHGRYHIDFKKPESLQALSWVLLKEDFGLNVLMPLDRLIPTVPLRLNYILWLEDILTPPTDHISGIDIGTGASCIYPLLAAKKNAWKFLATETDATNYKYAKKNVEVNEMTNQIRVVQVSGSSTLYDVLSDTGATYDFCMCNPPFFGSNFEAWGMLTSRSSDRPEPSSVSTASPVESIIPGGEVEFVKRMINDSLTLRGRIRVYTTMLGKKSSLSVLKEELRRNGVTNMSQTEFCQGKTMRWGLGWSFDNSIIFPKSPVKAVKADKPKPPLVYHIPHQGDCQHDSDYSLEGATEKILRFLRELQIAVTDKKKFKKTHSFTITASKNTWSNQRKKRRQQQKSQATVVMDTTQVIDQNKSYEHTEGNADKIEQPSQTLEHVAEGQGHSIHKSSNNDFDQVQSQKGQESGKDCGVEIPSYNNLSENETKRKISNEVGIDYKKRKSDDDEPDVEKSVRKCEAVYGEAVSGEDCTDKSCDVTSKTYIKQNKSETNKTVSNKSNVPESSRTPVEDCLLTGRSSPEETMLMCCRVSICAKADNDIVLEMCWIDGENKEAMHQVLQYIKNKLQ